MDKSEAMKRLDAIEAEVNELRRIIEEPEQDCSKWVGKWGFYSDSEIDLALSECMPMRRLEKYQKGADLPFRVAGVKYRYFRPATAEELGIAIEPDWSKAPEWAMWWARDEDGDAYWYENGPEDKNGFWKHYYGNVERDVKKCVPNWRDTLRKRPE